MSNVTVKGKTFARLAYTKNDFHHCDCDCAELAIVNQHVKIIEIQLDCILCPKS